MNKARVSAAYARAADSAVTTSLSPIQGSEFGYLEARHLLMRAGFGGTPGQIRTLVKWGPTKSVDQLLELGEPGFEPPAADLFDKDIVSPLTSEQRGELARARRNNDEETVSRFRAMRMEIERKDREQAQQLQTWWLKRMIETPRPLEEKMTLFWHGIFATSYRTIEDSYHMFQQNQLFRKHAVGSYADLLRAIIRDPAMIKYLDNDESRKNKPNENLARELMELFSLGVGNYGEQDIKEGARALTGYTFDDDSFKFDQKNHDGGNKRILGRSGKMDGEDFVAAILAQPACAKYIAMRLYKFFVADYPSGNREIDQAAKSVVSSLESTLRGGGGGGYQIKPVLRKLLLSEHFYQSATMGQQVKSPADVVVGMVRQFQPPVRDMGVLVDAMGKMGQNILYPPSVKGWNGGATWINTSTLFIRQNIACFLISGRKPHGFDPLAKDELFDARRLLQQILGKQWADKPTGEAIDEILRFSLGRVSPHNRASMVEFVDSRGGKITPEVFTHMLLLITAMPEYQLC